jgi:protein ImuB
VRAAIAPLPVAALRIAPAAAEGLARLGLRTVGDLALLPRGAVARRFGVAVVRRLDQALGAEPEPVAAGRPAPSWAVRLSAPEPLARVEDVAAGLDRLLARLCATLAAQGMGARRLRLGLRRVDRADAHLEVGLARPSRDAAQIAELFARPLGEADAGFGIDALRLEALAVEPLGPRQTRGPLDPRGRDDGEALATLLSRLGGRLGFEAVTRFLPADSHIPARAFTVAAAGWSEPHEGPWPAPPGLRPLTLWRPEPVVPEGPGGDGPSPPPVFRWRGRRHAVAAAFGPERIAPAWWLDEPDWRTGPRDYWRIETATGERLWLFHAPRSDRIDRWFAEGAFG